MISDIIKNYVDLKKKGNNYIGLCPFHDDTKPSLVVNDNKECYKCFACGNGGNSLSFIINKEKCDLPTAKQKVNEILGIEKFKIFSNDKKEISNIKNNELFLMITNRFMFNHSDSVQGLNYLNNRKIKPETIKKYNIGFSPNDKKLLIELLSQSNDYEIKGYDPISQTDLINNGWATVLDDGSVVSSFQNRIIFPIINVKNQIIGYSSRAINEDVNPKYYNTPNLNKNTLFGINKIDKNTNSIYICEGLIDCLTLNQLGFNAVSTMSINYNKEQLEELLLFPNLKHIMICFDNDKSGFESSIDLFKDLRRLNKHWVVNFIDYYQINEKDINEIYCNYDEEAINQLCDNGIDLNLYKTNNYIKILDPKKSNDWMLINQDINIKDSIFRNIICERLLKSGFEEIANFYLEPENNLVEPLPKAIQKL